MKNTKQYELHDADRFTFDEYGIPNQWDDMLSVERIAYLNGWYAAVERIKKMQERCGHSTLKR